MLTETITDMILDEGTIFTYIGYAAAIATILTFTIQIIKIIETKTVTNLSSYMYIIYTLGLICWAAYGVSIENWLIVTANLVTFLFTFTILVLILYYDAEDKIERARRDPVTYVFNRQYFEQTAPIKIAENIVQDQKSSVLMITAENHGAISKKYGTKIGNNLLKTLAKFLEKDLRENDMVARFDESRFVVFLYGADKKSAQLVAERLLKNSKHLRVKTSKQTESGIDLKISMSSTDKTKDLSELIANTESKPTTKKTK